MFSQTVVKHGELRSFREKSPTQQIQVMSDVFFKYHGNSVWKLKDTHSILKGARVHKPEQKRWHALPETNIASA